MIVGRWAAGFSLLLAIDAAITAIWWGLEANPVALWLGLVGFLFVHLWGIVWLVWADANWPEVIDHPVSKIAMGSCMIWYSVITIHNLTVVL